MGHGHDGPRPYRKLPSLRLFSPRDWGIYLPFEVTGMDSEIFKFIFELDVQLAEIVHKYQAWAYALMFSMIVMETGMVFFAILPGDSLLFAAGAVSAQDRVLDIRILLPMMALAAFAGDQVNFCLGKLAARNRMVGGSKLLSKARLEKAKRFYDSKGGQAIIIGRFIPVIRSVVPLSAALSGMRYARFASLSCIGALLWTGMFTLLGFYFGKLPYVRDHFTLILGGIMLASLLPGIVEFFLERKNSHPLRKPRTA
jgi:membrane-associated protein